MMSRVKQFNISVFFIFLTIILFSGITIAMADDYPNRPIKLIVPNSPGGASDLMSRITMPFLEKELGVPIVIENRPGAGSQLGTMEGFRADPDGYTFMQWNQPHYSITILLQGAPYTIQDLAVVCAQQKDPACAIVLKDSPYKDFVDVIEDIKENPGKVAMGAGQLSGGHIFLEDLKSKLNLDFNLVIFTGGGGEGRPALLGGHVDVYIANIMSNMAVRDQTRALGVGGDEEHILWPEAKTFDEQLLSKYNYKAPRLASLRGFAFSKEFKEKYPERFDKFVAAYKRAYHNEDFFKANEKANQAYTMQFVSSKKAQEEFEAVYQTMMPYVDILKGVK